MYDLKKGTILGKLLSVDSVLEIPLKRSWLNDAVM